MQVRCKVYGFTNASSGVECTVERDLLEVGESLHHNDQDYIIISVVENHGGWFANVVPEYQRPFVPRPLPLPRRQNGEEKQRGDIEEWRQRVLQAERKVHTLQEAQQQFGKCLDHLMYMLEQLTKEPHVPPSEPHRPLQRHEGGTHVR